MIYETYTGRMLLIQTMQIEPRIDTDETRMWHLAHTELSKGAHRYMSHIIDAKDQKPQICNPPCAASSRESKPMAFKWNLSTWFFNLCFIRVNPWLKFNS